MIAFGCWEKAANGHCVCVELIEVIWRIRGEIYTAQIQPCASAVGPTGGRRASTCSLESIADGL